MNTEVKAIVDAFIANDYSMMKEIFEKKSVNDDDFQLMLLNSKDNKNLQNIFTIKSINVIHTMISKIQNIQPEELDLSEYYPDIVEFKEYAYSILDPVRINRDISLEEIRSKLNIKSTYSPTTLESAAVRFLILNKPTEIELDFELPVREVEVEYCLEPFKYVEASVRGYGSNKYIRFTIDESNILHHKTVVRIEYPRNFEQSDLKVRKVILKEMIDSINQTQNMSNELTRRLELEVLYNNIKDGITAKEELDKNIDERRVTLMSLETEVASKQTELESLIEEVTSVSEYISELEAKKEELNEIAEKELERDRIDALLAEIAEKNAKYEHYLKIADKIDYYDSMETEMKLWQHCYMNMKDISSKLSQADHDLKEKQKELDDERIKMEEEYSTKKSTLDADYNDKVEALKAKEQEFNALKNENDLWKASVEAACDAKIIDYEDTKKEIERVNAENNQLKDDKKNLEAKILKLQNALDVLKSTWSQ